MRKKWFLPLLTSILIIIIGVVFYIKITNHWQAKKIPVNHAVIDKVDADSQTLDLKTIIHEAEKQVVQIEGQNDHTTTTGSGFLYNDKGDIITNAHVISESDIIYVRTANAHLYPAAIVGIDDETDIAVVRVPELAGQSFLDIEKEMSTEIGDEIIALGSPHGFQNTVTLGIISGLERNFSVDGYDYKNVYQISAQITHGNSGGPLINRHSGKVIGVNSVGTEDGTIGFSIPMMEVAEQVEKWSDEVDNEQLEFAHVTDMINSFNTDQLEEDANYLIDYFFESLQMRDYINVYTLLGSQMQSDLSYTEFRETYTHIVELDYEIISSDISETEHLETIVDVTTSTKSKDEEKTDTNNVEYKITIGQENDQLKILKISTLEP